MAKTVARTFVLTAIALLSAGADVHAQQSVNDVLSFLLTNRSIPTADFLGDAQAAAAARDTISTFLLSELGTLPVTSSATGFTYRTNPSLGGVPTRATESFGPFFTEGALSIGARRLSFGATFQHAAFDRIDGRDLDTGTLVATASKLVSETKPFDVETVTLRLRTNTATFSANAGLTDRLEIGVEVPVVSLTLDGERLDTYRGTAFVQAIASASASGVGDMRWRVKYNPLRGTSSGLAIVVQGRLPTGRTEDLLGAGRHSFGPAVIASVDRQRLSVNGNVGYVFGALSTELDYGVGLTAAATSHITVVGELVGRRLQSSGHLTHITAPHPVLIGVETIRLTAVAQSTSRAMAVAGLKWNVAAAWLVAANLSRSLTDAGLTAGWVPAVGLEYSFGG